MHFPVLRANLMRESGEPDATGRSLGQLLLGKYKRRARTASQTNKEKFQLQHLQFYTTLLSKHLASTWPSACIVARNCSALRRGNNVIAADEQHISEMRQLCGHNLCFDEFCYKNKRRH
jgi:hypothetical protein